MNKIPSIMWVGLRGFPNVAGGVEQHAEQICPLLVELGCQVDVICRSTYQSKNIGDTWKGVKFHSIWVPRTQGLEAMVHTFFGVLYAGLYRRPDILHIQAIGPAIMAPLARLLGLKVVVTNHGPDYDRQKWGKLAKLIIKMGEYFGMRFSHERIVISELIQAIVQTKYHLNSHLIPNGVVVSDLMTTQIQLQKFGLLAEKYILLVSRLVPEKRHLDLIAAFKQLHLPMWKLVIVGDIDQSDAYTQTVLSAADSKDIVLTGFMSGNELAEIYSHAGLFVLPSSHEGLPITLLESMSYGLPVLASDIKANIEIGLPQEQYFKLGDKQDLSEKILALIQQPITNEMRELRRNWVKDRYNWQAIAQKTLAVYQNLI